MNSAKTLLVFAVLAAVGIGSYMAFNKSPPPPPIEQWTTDTETKIGPIDEGNSASTGNIDPYATPGGRAEAWNPPGSPTDAASPGLARFGESNQSFDQRDSGNRQPRRSKYESEPPYGSPRARPDTIPAADSSGGNFGTQDGVNVPSPSTNFDPSAFDSRADVDRPGIDALGLNATTYSDAMTKAQQLMRENQLATALAMLSRFYDDPKLSPAQHRELNSVLDQLAGRVVYSREYSIEDRPYIVRGGESLQVIAEAHKVPWQLLAKINGIEDPNRLEQGQQLKVIEGPFKAIISLDRRELTLMVQNRYAGRFPIDVQGIAPLGRTQVRTKNHTGDRFLELTNNVRICGPNYAAAAVGGTTGCTAVLSQRDVDDLFDILQVKCDVLIRR